MTREEFAITTKELEDYYAKDLNLKQKEAWYRELNSFDSTRYAEAIRKLCMHSRYMPLLNEVIEAIRTVPVSREKNEKMPCDLCNGTGYLTYQKMCNGMKFEYSCLCMCANSNGKEYNSKEYYIPTAYEVFGDRIQKQEFKRCETTEKDVKKIVNSLSEQMCF